MTVRSASVVVMHSLKVGQLTNQVRDFSAYAIALHGKSSSTQAQQDWALGAVRKPAVDAERFDRVWQIVRGYDGAYEMRP